jgi:hypothetical protein
MIFSSSMHIRLFRNLDLKSRRLICTSRRRLSIYVRDVIHRENGSLDFRSLLGNHFLELETALSIKLLVHLAIIFQTQIHVGQYSTMSSVPQVRRGEKRRHSGGVGSCNKQEKDAGRYRDIIYVNSTNPNERLHRRIVAFHQP